MNTTNTEPRKIAIIGSGAIGGYVASQLAPRHGVVLCVRTPFEKLVIVEKGEEMEVPVRIASDPADVGPVDWILVTTKAQDVAGAAEWFAALSGQETVTVMIQNGIDHEARVRPLLGAGAPVIPSIIVCSVERKKPGYIVHHGRAHITVPAGGQSEAFAELFTGSTFKVEAVDDFLTVSWKKLMSNAMVNPVTSLTLRRLTVTTEPLVAPVVRELGREVVAVARAAGAKLTNEDVERNLAGFADAPGGGSSMLYDRLLGRPLEYEYITGAVVATADRLGVPVPINRTILALISGASGHKLDGSE
ncbi:2-dehydropantoate 2-reductase [Tianweitania sediminis]|uniref:2-dehydropantoate 2-reductase n=1 Tax=Tianweitania sediminis TaxID=1502156 RepID=A0A8J7R4F7_9HYPH|nr:2-dehydropantoate 2-reductase [Tianweitania sediminis]